MGMALKIFDVYGSKTVEIVKRNPYRLVEDVDGIGFSDVDTGTETTGSVVPTEVEIVETVLDDVPPQAANKPRDDTSNKANFFVFMFYPPLFINKIKRKR